MTDQAGDATFRAGEAAPANEAERHAWYRAMGWWPGQSLLQRYRDAARGRGSALAVVDNRGRRLSHDELWAASGRLLPELQRAGLQAGEVALIFLPNWVEWQIALVAVLRLGAVPANMPIRTDAEMLAYAAELGGVRTIITTERFADTDLAELARAAAAACPHRHDVVTLAADGGCGFTSHQDKPLPAAPAVADLDHIVFTSSTTGRPKAVMHSADTLAALNLTFSERFSLGPDDAIFLASPLGHSIGAYHGARLSLYNAAPLVLLDSWDPAGALAMIEEFGCVFTSAATPFLKDLVDAPWDGAAPKLNSLRWFLCGGAQVPPALMQAAREQFPNTFVTVLWGMTEGGLTTCHGDSADDKVSSTAGVGLPGLELRIIDEHGNGLAAGEEGELAMRGPGVFIGYYGQDAFYAEQLTADGFFRTGDLACLDADGYVRITGRLKDMIIRGGVNIAPVPIEDALASHPNVAAVAVIGAPDERLGERICAVVVAAGPAPGLEELNAHLTARGLPKYHCPESLLLVDAMPMTPAGKIRKADLRATLFPKHEGGAA